MYMDCTRTGTFAVVTYDKNTEYVTKKQNTLTTQDEITRLVLTTFTDCVISTSLNDSLCRSLPIILDIDTTEENETKVLMPYYGEPLHIWVNTTHKYQRINRIRDLICQLAEACQALLDYDLQHTDIKPSNILIDKIGQLTLIDYNIYSVRTILGWSDSIGTWCYVAPEILFRDEPHDTSMVYSIGIIIAEICGGFPLGNIHNLVKDVHNRKHWQSFIQKLKNTYPMSLPLSSYHLRNLPEEFQELFTMCTCWSPEQRPSLQQIISHLRKDHPRPPQPLHNKIIKSNYISPCKSPKRNEIIDKITNYCLSKSQLHPLLYHSIWLFDAYGKDDDLSVASCITVSYVIIGYTPDDEYVSYLNKYISSDPPTPADPPSPTDSLTDPDPPTYPPPADPSSKLLSPSDSLADPDPPTYPPPADPPSDPPSPTDPPLTHVPNSDSAITLTSIEKCMITIATDLNWNLYHKGADSIALSCGVSISNILRELPAILKRKKSPYTNLTIARILNVYKDTWYDDNSRYAYSYRNQQTFNIRHSIP